VTAGCRCGAPMHPEHPDRCAAGHVVKGNLLALVSGERSTSFWQEHDELYREKREEIATHAGHESYEDAGPKARAAIDGMTQAVILRDSDYSRIVQSGGVLTSSGRVRRVASHWQEMDRRVEAWTRHPELKRVPKEVARSPSEALARAPVIQAAGEER